MDDKLQITASIVLYNEKPEEFTRAINSFMETPLSKKLFLIDNSPQKNFIEEFKHPDIEYIFMGKNVGFGTGHNLILNKIKNISTNHLILNADVYFNASVIEKLIAVLNENEDVAVVAPKVKYPNGTLQITYRKYPTFLQLAKRFFAISGKKEEYPSKNVKPFSPDFLHGCFLLFKTKNFVKLNGFDERYFMYMEDVDIARKMDQLGMKKLYYPDVEITHIFKKGSSKNIRLFFIHVGSIIKYYQKWGWKIRG
jgi:hypothetical protein